MNGHFCVLGVEIPTLSVSIHKRLIARETQFLKLWLTGGPVEVSYNPLLM